VRRDLTHLRLVKLRVDYAGLIPVWDSDGEAVTIGDPELRARLLDWAANFELRFDVDSGWPSMECLLRHAEIAYSLVDELRRQFPESLVVWDAWETSYQA
jgi:hypothetical protein